MEVKVFIHKAKENSEHNYLISLRMKSPQPQVT